MKYNENLQKIAAELKLNQTGLADVLGLSRQQLSNIMNGKSFLTQKSLQILFDKYNINLNYLFSGEGSMFLSDSTEGNVMRIKVPKGTKLLVEYEE